MNYQDDEYFKLRIDDGSIQNQFVGTLEELVHFAKTTFPKRIRCNNPLVVIECQRQAIHATLDNMISDSLLIVEPDEDLELE
jgi:hypothetical protein